MKTRTVRDLNLNCNDSSLRGHGPRIFGRKYKNIGYRNIRREGELTVSL